MPRVKVQVYADNLHDWIEIFVGEKLILNGERGFFERRIFRGLVGAVTTVLREAKAGAIKIIKK